MMAHSLWASLSHLGRFIHDEIQILEGVIEVRSLWPLTSNMSQASISEA